jgi:hypothetical protein
LASCGTAPSRGSGNEKIFGLKFELSQKLRQFFFAVVFSRRSKWKKYADKVQGTYLILTFTQGNLGWKFK